MLKKLRKTLNLLWLKLTSLFKSKSMKSLSAQIENCIRTKILPTTPHIQNINHTTFTLNSNLFQIKCLVELENLYNFTLTIDFSNANDTKYTYDIDIKDGDILVETITEFNTKLNQQKKYINEWINSYNTAHIR